MNQGLLTDIDEVIVEAYDSGLFVSLFTAQQPNPGLDGTGAPLPGWTSVTGLVDIPCMNAPVSTSRIEATEVRDLQEILSTQIRHVLLNGYYPVLQGASDLGWNCLIDGVAFTIMGAESDSQQVMTRVHIRIASI